MFPKGKQLTHSEHFEIIAVNSFITLAPGAVFATLHFLHNLWMMPIS